MADITAIALSPSGATLASGEDGGRLKLWDVASGKNTSTLQDEHSHTIVYSLAFSPDGKTLASGAGEADHFGAVRLWDVASGANTATSRTQSIAVLSVAFSPDGKTLASGMADGTVRLWEVPTAK
jgi:WD40 repeat protein